jgi:hypothetical protein
MDIHRGVEGSAEDVIEAHKKDVETQQKHGVKYLNYWFSDDEDAVFCLFEGPSKEAGEKVHKEAHGLTADEIFEVEQGE